MTVRKLSLQFGPFTASVFVVGRVRVSILGASTVDSLLDFKGPEYMFKKLKFRDKMFPK